MARTPEPDTERVQRQASMLALLRSCRSEHRELRPNPGLCCSGGLEKHASLALKITLRLQHDDHFHSTPTEIKTADHSFIRQDIRAAGLYQNHEPEDPRCVPQHSLGWLRVQTQQPPCLASLNPTSSA